MLSPIALAATAALQLGAGTPRGIAESTVLNPVAAGAGTRPGILNSVMKIEGADGNMVHSTERLR